MEYIKSIIEWCNENQGFISAILSVLTIIISVIAIYFSNKVGKIPYKKKMKVIPCYYEENSNPIIEIMLINYGLMTLVISHIVIKDLKKEYVGGTSMLEPIVVKPSECQKFEIIIEDYNGLIEKNAIDLNNKMIIEVHEYGGKVHKLKKGFPVG